MLVDGAQRHEFSGGAAGHLRAVVAHGKQHRPGGVVHGRVDQPVLAGGDQLQQPFAFQRLGEHHLDLAGGLLRRDDLGQPLAADQVLDHGRGHPGAGEVGRVEHPDGVWGVLDPVWERLADRAAGPWQGPQPQARALQHPAHAGRRHPHWLRLRATMGELAMGAVDLAPLLEQSHDLSNLPVQQAVQRAAIRWLVLQLVGGAAPPAT
jgi:hypothetical protein